MYTNLIIVKLLLLLENSWVQIENKKKIYNNKIFSRIILIVNGSYDTSIEENN